ncbi:ribonuclease E [Desulfobaculum xiamenense]|uniref:Ribonuclease G n=1 Tax=Desulfobaculum xiamenense TaxID=995050 RepID=A0A846QQK2_9BACT|nr:Rne/Rng family ribonuclease [Desulfobaculum xiamenense]NJB68633.1 ribonuclease E [Desulfobaculum xiamenense]
MAKSKRQRMFISVLPGEQVEMAITEDGKLDEYYVEMLHQAKTKGNIYKGVINNIDPSLQAAFVNYGAERNGFLQIDEVHPEYYHTDLKPQKGFKYPPIQKVLRPGDEVLVQVVKEPTGKKGAFVTTYLSLPGRYFVLTIGREQIGISRKIEDETERTMLRSVVEEQNLGPAIGVIVRTAAAGVSKTRLTKDLKILKRLWKEIVNKVPTQESPSLVYQEMDLASRAVRDYLNSEIGEIWVDHEETAKNVAEMVSLVFPRRLNLVKQHTDHDRGLFDRFNVEKQIQSLYDREVVLPSGGRLVIDTTEALTAVDINSGKIGGKKNFREMALKTNMEAAEEIAHQLRLRDIGGQIVIDFIEMKDKNHCRDVEKTMRAAVKIDRARTDVGRLSRFGLMEMVRQRLGSSALAVSTEPCPCCNGTGTRRNLEWQALQALKEIYRKLRANGTGGSVEYRCPAELAAYLSNTKRSKLLELETEFAVALSVLPE